MADKIDAAIGNLKQSIQLLERVKLDMKKKPDKKKKKDAASLPPAGVPGSTKCKANIRWVRSLRPHC
jgi:hypothetical protein